VSPIVYCLSCYLYPSATAIPQSLCFVFSTIIKSIVKKLTNKWLLVYLFLPFLVFNFLSIGENHNVFLAYSFLKFSPSLVTLPKNLIDLSYFESHYFWPLGPFPAILLIPFVFLFKLNFQESFLKLPLTVLNFWLVYQIAKSIKLPENKAFWLAVFFIFGSVYTPVALLPFSVYFSQIIVVTFLLLAIYIFLAKKNYLLIGLLVALASLTRQTLILSGAFFAITLLARPVKLTNVYKFMMPLLAALIITGTYNFARFGNYFESGYSYQIIPQEQVKRREHGLFSFQHIPANLYYLFLKTPDPVLAVDGSHVLKPPFLKTDYYGLSIFFISPILLLVLLANFKNQLNRLSLIATAIILLPILLYYGIGYKQIGYRYALDFLPFLLFPLASAFKKVSIFYIAVLVLIGVFWSWFFVFEKLIGF